jgi:hypothetical protein
VKLFDSQPHGAERKDDLHIYVFRYILKIYRDAFGMCLYNPTDRQREILEAKHHHFSSRIH